MTLFFSDFAVDSTTGVPGFDLFTSDSTGKKGFVTNGGSAATDTTATSLMFPQGQTFSSDQFAQMKLTNNSGSSTGLVVRASTPASATDTNGYLARTNGTAWAIISLAIDGTGGTLASGTKTRVAGDIARFTAEGTVLKLYVNDLTTPFLTYDTASDAVKYTTGRAGVRAGGTLTTRVDDFYSGDIADIAQIGAPAPSVAPTLSVSITTDSRQDLVIGTVSGASSYVVEYKKTADSSWITFGSVPGPTIQITGLLASTSYDYRVSAKNAAGTGPVSAIRTATTTAPFVRTIVVNPSPADGSPKWKGLVYGPSGRIILPGKPVHRLHADFFGPAGAYTPPSWLQVTGTATMTDSATTVTRLELTTGATVGSAASLSLSPAISTAFYAVRIDVEALSFASATPGANLRMGAANASTGAGGGMIQWPADSGALLYSGGEGNLTQGVFSHLGDTANQRRQTSVIVLNNSKHVFMLEDDMMLTWRDGTTGWVDGVVTPSLSIESTSTTPVSLRLASITFTLYA